MTDKTPPARKQPKPLGPGQIRLAYRLFLGRLPGEEELARMIEKGHTPATMRQMMLRSAEFLAKNPAPAPGAARPGGPLDLAPIDDERLVYLHVPKCGGTTLHALLSAWYGAHAVHPERLNGLYRYTAAEMTRYKVFSGHYDHYATRLVPGRKRLISFLRDPRDRLISLYHFHRAHKPEFAKKQNLVLARWAIELDINAYFANETVREHLAVNNSIVRHFSDVPQTGHRWLGAPDPRMNDVPLMRDQALANLDTFEFIGFMDRYDASVAHLAEILGKPPVEKIKAQQTLDGLMQDNPNMRRIDKQTPSDETLERIEELIVHDREIYAAARKRFALPG